MPSSGKEWHLSRDSTADVSITYDPRTRAAAINLPSAAQEFRITRGKSTDAGILLFKAPGPSNSSWADDIRLSWASWIIADGAAGSSNYWTMNGDLSASGFGVFGGRMSVSSNATFEGNLVVDGGATINTLQVSSEGTVETLVVTSNLTLSALGGVVSAGATDGSSYLTLRVPSGS